MKDLPISKRLLTTFGVILAMFACTVVLSIFSLFSIGGNFDVFYEGPYEITNKCADLRATIQTVAKYIGYSMMEEDSSVTESYINAAEDSIQALREGTAYLTEKFPEAASLVEGYDNVMKSIKEDRDKVLQLALENKNSEAIELYFNNVMPAFLEANDYLLKIDDEAVKLANSNYNSASTQKSVITIILLALSVITFLVTIYMARFIIKSITTPILEMEKAAKEMSEGSLNVTIEYESGDELGSLANSMRVLTTGVKLIVEDVGNILSELADGNFHITSGCLDKYKQDYEPILTAMRLIRDKLNGTLIKISEATQQVSIGSSQMAQSAQGLAEGASEQAGAVEELTATIENVGSLAETSAQGAKEAYEHVRESSEKAENSKKEMSELIDAMERISSTSKEIENIIAAIEDIASQTNLLSLNASIEAARAGEAGRGFAVVADQIGKLASDSAQSAVNTKELISKTLEEIEVGNSITNRTSKAFEEVIEDMKEFAGVARDTSDSLMSQFESLKQVQTGIEQISNVVQSNSAAAQETSATSEELAAQADNLESQVNQFKLLV